MAKLIVNPTASNRREIPLTRTTILTIGRDPSNDLVLPDAMVSRRHAVVENRGRQFDPSLVDIFLRLLDERRAASPRQPATSAWEA